MIKIEELRLSLAEINVLEFNDQLDKYIFDILHQNTAIYFRAVAISPRITCYSAFDWSSNTLTCDIELVKGQLTTLISNITFIYKLQTPFICPFG